ncbi:MAG TPA: PAS domain S-box protein [Rhizomicrobium sp.]|nr:PAS domain S-box protein [Rhizomicrobium sp.]
MVRPIGTLRYARIGIFAVILICGVALAGWQLEIPVLTSFVPGWPRIARIVLFCFVLCSAGVLELTLPARHRFLLLARIAGASLVLAISVSVLIDFAAAGGPDARIPAFRDLFGPRLERPHPASAFNFLMAATALLLPRTERFGRIFTGLITLGLIVTAFNFVGYAYGIAALSRGPTISAMALPTMIAFILFFLSALLARSGSGWTAVILARDSGGITARRLFPVVLAFPFMTNGIILLAHRSHPFEAPFGFAILAVITAIGLGTITIVIADWVARGEEGRQRSQALLEAVVDNSMAMIHVKDLAGRYLMVNRRYLDIFHVDRKAVIGKTDYDIFPKQEADAFRATDEQVVRTGHPLTAEEWATQADGVHAYVSIKAPLRDAGGRSYATFGISTDITESKRSERALAASEERTRLIVETALDAVVSIDRGGAITGWNPQAEKIFGWTRQEALGRPIEETIMPQRFRAAHKNGLARYLATGEARVLDRRIELTALHRDGCEFPVELSITPTGTGDAAGFSAFLRDITERKGSESRLQSQLARLALLERITHAVGQRQDLRSIFQVVVRTLEDRLPADFVCIGSYDSTKNEITIGHVGANSTRLGHELGIAERATIAVDGNGLSRCMQGVLVYEPDIAAVDYPFARRLAGQGLRSLVISPLMIEQDIFGILVAARRNERAFNSADCEFLRQLGEHVALAGHQAQLRNSLETAYNDLKQTQQTIMQQERLRALGQMASGIAHDINNAISPVAVYTQSLLEREPDLPAQVHRYLETVDRVVKDVSATVGRMRDFYRRNDADSELRALNLNTLIPQVVELTRARWNDMPQQRGIVIRIVTQLENDLPLVLGNAAELREAATNLIFNAVDAMPKGGTITIRTVAAPDPSRPGAGRVRLEVEDSGVGMDEDTRRRCLEPFFTTKGERGTGLGLAMVYGTAQRHKAKLDIQSAPGKGTGMILSFAATEERQEQEQRAKAPTVPVLRILLVDDDPSVLESTRYVLELDGHSVVPADGGRAGIDALREAKKDNRPFDVLVTDLGMPYVDGNAVARATKELFPATMVVLLTGWGIKMGEDGKRKAHVDHVLPKPFDLNELRAVFLHHPKAQLADGAQKQTGA